MKKAFISAALIVLTTSGMAFAEEMTACQKEHKECIERANQLQIVCGDPTSDCSKETRKAKLLCDDILMKCSESTQPKAQ